MKRLFFIAASVLLVSYAVSVGAAPQPTPAMINNGKNLTPHPLLHQVNLEMKQQWQKIMLDQKDGKLTPDQAKAVRQTLIGIRKQIATDFKNSPTHELTADQAAQINQQLQTNAQSIP
jgi:hypothetical protein